MAPRRALQLVPVWQAKKAVAEKKAAEEAEKVRPPHTEWMRSPSHCERRVLMR